MTSTPVTTPPKLRIPALTGLRWFAALAVFFHHSAAHDSLPEPVRRIMGAGSNGVTFFFLLSGFVIALNYFDGATRPTPRGTWNYLIGRLARVYPLYLLVLVVVWLAVDHHSNTSRFLIQVLALQSWHPSLVITYGINAPGWSIGVEFFLYACFPLLVLVLRPIANNARALLAVAAATIVATFVFAALFQHFRNGLPATNPFSAHRWLYRTPATRLGDFTLGVVTALLLRQAKLSWSASATRDRVLSPMLTWLPLVATLLLMAWPDRTRYYASYDALWMLPGALLFFGLGQYPQSMLGRFLSTRAVVLLGEVSFAFYLVHRPLMLAVGEASWMDDSLPAYLAKMTVLVAFITVVAAGCHFLWERPAQRLVNRYLRIRPPAAPGGTPTPTASSTSEVGDRPQDLRVEVAVDAAEEGKVLARVTEERA
ncbi:acyltransferase family protein [Micromonospora tarensis]|uniref:Acyltransferase n=1 Tax=Micromonospora tarensis TaxID=2806100 RepID=A0ABS1YIS9_9ACTN|nr:acyltransferase [Micromonospora tarensis]MBM0277272.1 acyltransferase [Micromonospora tarensis]